MAESPYGKLTDSGTTLFCGKDPCDMYWYEQGGCCLELCWTPKDANKSCCDKFCDLCYMLGCVCLFRPCARAKLFASSMNQDCAIVNHCFIAYTFPVCTTILTRHNVRKKLGIGNSGWLGDICMVCFCPICATLQMYRALPTEAWDWTTTVSDTEWMLTPWILAT